MATKTRCGDGDDDVGSHDDDDGNQAESQDDDARLTTQHNKLRDVAKGRGYCARDGEVVGSNPGWGVFLKLTSFSLVSRW